MSIYLGQYHFHPFKIKSPLESMLGMKSHIWNPTMELFNTRGMGLVASGTHLASSSHLAIHLAVLLAPMKCQYPWA
jgi:hypothetical protein